MEQITNPTPNTRLDVFLTEYFDGEHTRSQITNSIKSGQTTLNGVVVKPGTILKSADIITAHIEPTDIPATPQDIPLDIIHQDDHLMIVNKPRGMTVHPGAGVKSGTLLNGLLFYLCRGEYHSPASPLMRAGIVHRLDKNTAGLMVVAKTKPAQAKLFDMFAAHTVNRTYTALVQGNLQGSGTITRNIIRDPNRRTLFKTADVGGRTAITHYRVLENFGTASLVEFNLETGRTHQIRVHAKSIGHPIIGDPEYNPNSPIKASGQMLESTKIQFVHPVTGKHVSHEIPPTAEFKKVLAKIQKK